MSTFDAASAYLETQALPWRVRIVPRAVRQEIVWGWTEYRGHLSGPALRLRIRQHVLAATKSSLPPWAWALLIDVAIKVIVALLEAWWEKRHAA